MLQRASGFHLHADLLRVVIWTLTPPPPPPPRCLLFTVAQSRKRSLSILWLWGVLDEKNTVVAAAEVLPPSRDLGSVYSCQIPTYMPVVQKLTSARYPGINIVCSVVPLPHSFLLKPRQPLYRSHCYWMIHHQRERWWGDKRRGSAGEGGEEGEGGVKKKVLKLVWAVQHLHVVWCGP